MLLQQYAVSADRKISQISKGMWAKVLLSLALAHQPQLLILDEPTSGLDTLVRREFLESIVDIAAAGRTVLLSNHFISEVERVADIVAIMREGRLLVVESLDTFKCQTRELTITLAAGAAAPPEIPGQVLASRRRSRQWQVLVRDVSEADVDALRNNEATVAVEARTPGLEEIFVAYMQSEKQLDRVSGGGHATATATAPSPEQCNERRHQHNQPANSCQLRGQRQTHLPPLRVEGIPHTPWLLARSGRLVRDRAIGFRRIDVGRARPPRLVIRISLGSSSTVCSRRRDHLV